jgi:hypothetical protein
MKVHELRDRLHSEPAMRDVVMYDAFGFPQPVKVIALDRTIGAYAEGSTLLIVPDFDKSARGATPVEKFVKEKRKP